MRRDNTYLYGTEDVPEIPKCIIEQRLYLIERNLKLVLDQRFQVRDTEKQNYLLKAREFWTEMLKNNGGY